MQIDYAQKLTETVLEYYGGNTGMPALIGTVAPLLKCQGADISNGGEDIYVYIFKRV